ncbi:auxin-responsive protein SAUR41-like [Panicum miliaceum]|uniref:Auxin-responsive protein SAUR41-like n=1 Tax=Panicum miliaceum TaxID=4540 RepID=A0A3L6RFJ5_PANMI|nr:auxin-responsive protein SAUR41-like [Panicum miliaceum]
MKEGGEKNILAQTLQRCRTSLAAGYFTVLVGPEKERFGVRARCANHPLFRALLDEAETEYGFAGCDGPLELPCAVDDFMEVMWEMEQADPTASPGCGRFAGAGAGSRGGHHQTTTGYQMDDYENQLHSRSVRRSGEPNQRTLGWVLKTISRLEKEDQGRKVEEEGTSAAVLIWAKKKKKMATRLHLKLLLASITNWEIEDLIGRACLLLCGRASSWALMPRMDCRQKELDLDGRARVRDSMTQPQSKFLSVEGWAPACDDALKLLSKTPKRRKWDRTESRLFLVYGDARREEGDGVRGGVDIRVGRLNLGWLGCRMGVGLLAGLLIALAHLSS